MSKFRVSMIVEDSFQIPPTPEEVKAEVCEALEKPSTLLFTNVEVEKIL